MQVKSKQAAPASSKLGEKRKQADLKAQHQRLLDEECAANHAEKVALLRAKLDAKAAGKCSSEAIIGVKLGVAPSASTFASLQLCIMCSAETHVCPRVGGIYYYGLAMDMCMDVGHNGDHSQPGGLAAPAAHLLE